MLKITRVAGTNDDPMQTLVLEGQLLAPWVAEVRTVCAELTAGAINFRLNLAAVIFVDAAGLELLHDMIRAGIRIVACSSFLAAMLDRETL